MKIKVLLLILLALSVCSDSLLDFVSTHTTISGIYEVTNFNDLTLIEAFNLTNIASQVLITENEFIFEPTRFLGKLFVEFGYSVIGLNDQVKDT